MKRVPVDTIYAYFGQIPDPLLDRTKRHSLKDIIVIAICAVICGADGWVAVEEFGKSKIDWFRRFLDLPNRIPSHDTFGRVFSLLDSEQFMGCFASWISNVARLTSGEVVAVDGKTLRRSFDTASSKSAIHMVSAWACENGLVLGQVTTDQKSNEITAIPKLLDGLELSGCIVTIDAMGCQKKIAKKIVDKDCDYLFGLKGNQGALNDDVREFFRYAEEEQFEGIPHDYVETVDGEHGRIETRRIWCTSDTDWFEEKHLWKGLSSFGMVESERLVGDKTSVERRYFISSLAGDDAEQFGRAVRQHWQIENKLHWTLDISFREDDCRVRSGHAAENIAVLRHIALNLLKKEKSTKLGVQNKRLKAGWDDDFRLKVLLG
jgi:predicted transposase YbfD/YdcC